MGGMITLFILLLTIFHVFSLLLNSVIAVNPSGFSMKIFHQDSKESPLYPGDHLTQEERFQRLINQSMDRARYLGLQISGFNNNSINPDVARLPLTYELVGSFYVAMVGIGSFGDAKTFRTYYLMVDSGSQLIWTQCDGASSMFHQDEPLYPAEDSSTYRPLRCNKRRKAGASDPLCYPGECDKGICTYDFGYSDGSGTSGNLAKEKFTINSDNHELQSFDIVMGCGLKQLKFWPGFGSGFQTGKPDVIAGILGMSGGPRSLLSQLGEGKFEYCLKPYTDGTGTDTYLRFGSDTRIGREGQQAYTTPLYVHPPGGYHLILEDISVGGNRIGFQKGDFRYKEDTKTGGCLMDSGTPVSVMRGVHYDVVDERVTEYFQQLGIQPVRKPRGYFSLCFANPYKRFEYPTITFHFQNADFVLDNPDIAFSITAEDFCLGLLRGPDDFHRDIIIGAMQQARKRILHDVNGGLFSFAEEDCELDSTQ